MSLPKFIYISWVALMVAWLVFNAEQALRQGLNPIPVVVLTIIGLGLAAFAMSLTRGRR